MSEKYSNKIPLINSSSNKPRWLRERAESRYIGERELSLSNELRNGRSSYGEVLLLESLTGTAGSQSYFPANLAGESNVEEGKFLLTEFSLDTNETLQLDYSCLFNGAFKAIVAPFFGMRILSLASKNRVLLVPLSLHKLRFLRERLVQHKSSALDIDLRSQVIETGDKTRIEFQTATWHRDRLLNGFDDTDEIQALKKVRETYLKSDKKRRPWLYS